MHKTGSAPNPDSGTWFAFCETCNWISEGLGELSAGVAADHHMIEMAHRRNPRDRFMMMRVQVPPDMSDEKAMMQIVSAINLHTDCGVINIPPFL